MTKLPGLLDLYAGIDRALGAVTNVTVWDSLEHAHQMDSVPEMLAQRRLMETGGVTFEPTTNQATLWTITP